MANPIPCDLCGLPTADVVVSNQHTGDVLGLCVGCLPAWAQVVTDAQAPTPAPAPGADQPAADAPQAADAAPKAARAAKAPPKGSAAAQEAAGGAGGR